MLEHISNDVFEISDVPEIDADWSDIYQFALTFDGYHYWEDFKKCAEIANHAEEMYSKEG